MFSAIEYHSTKDKDFKSQFLKLKFKDRCLNHSVSFFIDKTSPKSPKTFFKKEKIDEGAYGDIYKFTETMTSVQLLIKEMSFYNEDELKGMLKEVDLFREANGFCAHQISFPHTFRLIMKRLPGKPLGKILDNSFEDPIKMIRKYIAILNTAKLLHKKNIVHGDLSIRNILLDDYTAYFCDFGLAAKSGEMTTGSWSQSYAYHAPELKEKIPANFNQDVYSLGIILFKLTADVPGIDRYLKPIQLLINHMTQKDPTKRISLQKATRECYKLRDLMCEGEFYLAKRTL